MLYSSVKGMAKVLSHLLYRFDVIGLENIPKEGAFLLCGNHISAYDPIALASFSKRQLRFMAKKELFKFPPLGAFLRAMGAFPVDRGTTDMQSYRHTINSLKEGHALVIFSQGTRMKDFENAKSGVAVFALKSGAPIVPVGIIGSYRFRTKMKIIIGEPILMDKYQGQKIKTEIVEEVMSTLAERIGELLK